MLSLIKKILGKIYHPIVHRIKRASTTYKNIHGLLRPYKSFNEYMDKNSYYPSSNEPCRISDKTAIQFHIYYTELLSEIHSFIKDISIPYDLYISTDTEEKKSEIESFFSANKVNAEKIIVQTFVNIGRDVYPFLAQMHPVHKEYEFIAHLHTKRTLYSKIGDQWRRHLYSNILGNGTYFGNAVAILKNDGNLGMLAPRTFRKIRKFYFHNYFHEYFKSTIPEFLYSIGIDFKSLPEKNFYDYSAGTMFIAKTKAVRQIFEKEFSPDDFADDKGQTNYTAAHIVERIWSYIMKSNGYEYKLIVNKK